MVFLLAEMAHDRFLSRYDTIIIGKPERSLNIDFIWVIERLLPKRPDLKGEVITSATLDSKV